MIINRFRHIGSLCAFFYKTQLRREITLVIIIKLIAIYLLWFAFFGSPLTPTLRSSNGLVAERLIGHE